MSFIPAIAGAIGGVATSLLGRSASASDRRKAMRLQRQALEYYRQVMPPDYSDLREYVSDLADQNMIDPKTEISILQLDAQGRSDVGDPQALDAQRDALQYLNNVVSEGGMTPQDQSFYMQISDQLDQQNKAQQKAIQADMQMRGVAGGGQELAARMAAGQETRQTASRRGLDLLAMSQQRRDQAARDLGSLGMDMRGQAFGEAQARDQALSGAKRQNLATGMTSANLDYTTGQSEYNAEMQRAQNLADTTQGISREYKDRAAQKEAMFGQMGQGISSIGGAYTDYLTKQNKKDS